MFFCVFCLEEDNVEDDGTLIDEDNEDSSPRPALKKRKEYNKKVIVVYYAYNKFVQNML